MSATPNGKERWMALDDIPGIATRDELIGKRRSRGTEHDVLDHLEVDLGRVGEHSGLCCARRRAEKNH